MTAPSGFVPDERRRASRELLKQVGMPAVCSEYFPVRNEGQPGVEDVIRSGCARSFIASRLGWSKRKMSGSSTHNPRPTSSPV